MILVTGGTGLVGSHLLIELCRKDKQHIRCTSRSPKANEEFMLIAAMHGAETANNACSRIEWVRADLQDYSSALAAAQGVSTVYHCAGEVSFSDRPADAANLFEINVGATANMVNAALDTGVNAFCHVSSIAAIGGGINGKPVTENSAWDKSASRSQYSLSKYLGEMEVWRAMAEGLNAVIVNPSVIIGAAKWGQSSAGLFSQVAKGLPFYPPGGTGWIDARDLARIMVDLTEAQIWGQRFIVSGENASFKDAIYLIAKYIGAKAPARELPRLLAELAWRADRAASIITGRKPQLSKQSVRAGFSNTSYSAAKLEAAIKVQFTSLENSIKYAAEVFANQRS
jgi:dihydroflavonol-4-reductase